MTGVQIGFSRHPDLPDVPLITELAARENLLPGYDYDEVQKLLRVQMTDVVMGRPFTFGPGVPKERVDAVRQAFDAMVRSEDFKAEAAKLKMETRHSTGEQLQTVARELKAMPKESLRKLGDMIKYQGPRESVKQ